MKEKLTIFWHVGGFNQISIFYVVSFLNLDTYFKITEAAKFLSQEEKEFFRKCTMSENEYYSTIDMFKNEFGSLEIPYVKKNS